MLEKIFMSGIKFPVKVRNTHKIEWKNQLTLVFLVIKVRKNIQSICQKNVEKKKIDFLLIERSRKKMFSSKILADSCTITQYILEEKIFIVIVYKLLEQQAHWNVMLMKALKSMLKKD